MNPNDPAPPALNHSLMIHSLLRNTGTMSSHLINFFFQDIFIFKKIIFTYKTQKHWKTQ